MSLNPPKAQQTIEILNGMHHSVQMLEAKVKEAESYCNALEREAFFHLSDICPEKCKRLLGDPSNRKLMSDEKLGKMDLHQQLYHSLTSCGIDSDSCRISYDENDNGELIKITQYSGKVKEIPFSIVAARLMNTDNEDTIIQLKLSQESNFLRELEESLVRENVLTCCIVPTLQKYQELREEMISHLEVLEETPGIKIYFEDDVCHIAFKIRSTIDVEIVWGFSFDPSAISVMNSISVNCSEEDAISFSQHKLYPILAGKEIIMEARGVSQFVEEMRKN